MFERLNVWILEFLTSRASPYLETIANHRKRTWNFVLASLNVPQSTKRIFKSSNIQKLKPLKTFKTSKNQKLKHSKIQTFESFKHSKNQKFKHLTLENFKHLIFWIFEIFKGLMFVFFWMFEPLSFWTFECLNVWNPNAPPPPYQFQKSNIQKTARGWLSFKHSKNGPRECLNVWIFEIPA